MISAKDLLKNKYIKQHGRLILIATAILSLAVASTVVLLLKNSDTPQRTAKTQTATNSNSIWNTPYKYSYPASQKLEDTKYAVNGLQIEYVTNFVSYDDPNLQSACDINTSSRPCYKLENGQVIELFEHVQGVDDCPSGFTCLTSTNTQLLTFKVTNVSDRPIDYTSCFESETNCSPAELTNQTNVINSFDIGCVAQRSGDDYKMIGDDKNVYYHGGFDADPNSQFDPFKLSNQTNLGAAITPSVATGTGPSLNPISIKFNPGETKTAKIELSHQCIAVGPPDKSVFWAL